MAKSENVDSQFFGFKHTLTVNTRTDPSFISLTPQSSHLDSRGNFSCGSGSQQELNEATVKSATQTGYIQPTISEMAW